MRHPAFIVFLFAWIILFLYTGSVLYRKRRAGPAQPPSVPAEPMSFGYQASETRGPGKDLYSDVGQSALLGKNQLAANLVLPKVSGRYAGFFDPENAAAGPGGATAPAASVERVVRGKRMHVIDATGWGVLPPRGFVLERGSRNTWKPAKGNTASARIIIKSGPACRPSCMGQPVSDSALIRGIVASRRSYSYRCPWVVKEGGKRWNYSDFSVIKLGGGTCVTMAVLTRTVQGRRRAARAFQRMRDSLQPLPRRPIKPMLEEKLKDNNIRLLR